MTRNKSVRKQQWRQYMTIKEKMDLHDRIEVARDILINIKNDAKILAGRTDNKEYLFVALKAADAAIAANKLALAVLDVENQLKDYITNGG